MLQTSLKHFPLNKHTRRFPSKSMNLLILLMGHQWWMEQQLFHLQVLAIHQKK